MFRNCNLNLFCGLYKVLMCSYSEGYREIRGVGTCRFIADGKVLLGLKISEGRNRPLLGHHLWNYSKGGIELGRDMVNYTSNNVSYAKDVDIITAFLTNNGGDESNTKNKKKGVADFYFNLRLNNTNELTTGNL